MEIFKQGESVTFGFSLPNDYDLNRIELIEVFLGSKKLTHSITDNVVKCQISSENTKYLSGTYRIMFTLDDSILGVKPIYCDSVVFNATGSSTRNASVNTGFDILFPLIITETAISVDVPLYNYFRGVDGKSAFEYAVEGGYLKDEATFYEELGNLQNIIVTFSRWG